jgi:hypothetical protein
MPDFAALIAKLEAWTEEGDTFHGTRQLADEVLIADGWRVEPDATFEGGERWHWGHVSTGAPARPHPIHDLNAAVGVLPFGASYILRAVYRAPAVAVVWIGDQVTKSVDAQHQRATVALLIAAFKLKAELRAEVK